MKELKEGSCPVPPHPTPVAQVSDMRRNLHEAEDAGRYLGLWTNYKAAHD